MPREFGVEKENLKLDRGLARKLKTHDGIVNYSN